MIRNAAFLALLVSAVTLGLAARAEQPQPAATGSKMGTLEIQPPDPAGHYIMIESGTDANTVPVQPADGAGTGFIGPVSPSAKLPAGTYGVTFGEEVWKDVQIRPGETTVLARAGLEFTQMGLQENKVLDAATGRVRAELSSRKSHVLLIPGRVTVMFGDLAVRDIELKAGEVTRIKTGRIRVVSRAIVSYKIFTAGGTFVGVASSGGTSLSRLSELDQRIPAMILSAC